MTATEPILIFETDPKMGQPCIKAMPWAEKSFDTKQLHQIEAVLRPRYNDLVRDGQGTIEHRGQQYQVKKKEGDTSRMPTLELRTAEASRYGINGSVIPYWTPNSTAAVAPEPKAGPGDWYAGFLEEIDFVIASAEFGSLPPAEKANLKVVAEELAGFREKSTPRELAELVLTALLMTADQIIRTQQPGRATYYAVALSALERLQGEREVHPKSPWGEFPNGPSDEPAPRWLSRMWAKLGVA